MRGESGMGSVDVTAAESLKGRFVMMRIIHAALVGGVVVFGGVVLVLVRSRMTLEPAFQHPLAIVAGGMAMGAIVVSSVMHRFFFRPGAMPEGEPAAVGRYQVLFLMRCAVVEGAALFSAVVTLITGNILPAGLLALCTAVLIGRYPSPQEFMRLMKRSG